MAEIELLQTAGEKLSFYLEPILFHKVMPLVDSPRLLVWYESSVCLWCACGLMKSSHSFLAAVIWRREMHLVCYWAFTHESLMDYMCVCTCVRNVIVVAAAPQSLMHNRNTVQVHHTWTTSKTETAACFALYCLRFALFHFTWSLPCGFLFDVIHVMQNWLQRFASVPNAMKLSQCKDRFPSIDSPDFTL